MALTTPDLKKEVINLSRSKHALILAHNYQLPEIQYVADFVGDSLELARKASEAKDCELIVFCGVHFMAETAAILNPQARVVLPDLKAGCPLADMIEPEDIRALKVQYPGCPVVAYINTSAAVKAEVDICCTSSNAVKVVNSFKEDTIVFVPDKYLATFVEKNTDKKIVAWDGFCPTHLRFKPEDILSAREKHPGAIVVVHPECREEVQNLADFVLSTGGMTRLPSEVTSREFVIGTETGMLYRLEKLYPDRFFYPLNKKAVCPNMKKINLEKLYNSLLSLEPTVALDPTVSTKARLSIERMLAIV